MNRCLLVLIGATLAAAGVAGAAAQIAPATTQREDSLLHRGGGARGYFAIPCAFSHRNDDDAIINPGHRGVSHNHTYFGNRTTNASSTPASLRGQATSCRLHADTAAYWVPTLFVDGRPVNPRGALVYYLRRTTADVQAFPAGLKVVAGNAAATRAQGADITYWICGRVRAASLAGCPTGFRSEGLSLVVKFPNCWNGTSLDSANHKSHLAYSSDGVCPASHPVAVPLLAVIVRYPALGSGLIALASGGQFSGHADFVNAWDQTTLERLVDRYLNRARRR